MPRDPLDASDPIPTSHLPDAKIDLSRIERAVREILLLPPRIQTPSDPPLVKNKGSHSGAPHR